MCCEGSWPWRFEGLPPKKVSSLTTRPVSSPDSGAFFMASLIRCSMNHADLGVRSYLRSLAGALPPSSAAHLPNPPTTPARTGFLARGKFPPATTKTCLRQAAPSHPRRSDREPVRVARDVPLEGFRKYGGRS